MVCGRRVCRDDWRRAGYKVCENADFDAALEDGELDIERGDFVCKALEHVVRTVDDQGTQAYIAESLKSPAGCTVHSQPRCANMRSYNCQSGQTCDGRTH